MWARPEVVTKGVLFPLLTSYEKTWAGKGYSLPLTHQCLGRVGGQALWSYDGELSQIPTATTLGWTGSAPHQLAQQSQSWECDNCPYYPSDLWCHGKKRDWPIINTQGRWESWSCGPKCGRAIPVSYQLQHSGEQRCTSSGQYNRANPLSTDTDDSVSKSWQWESCPYFPSSKPTLQLVAQAQTESYDLAYLNIHPIYDLLEHGKGPSLQIQSRRDPQSTGQQWNVQEES